MPNGAPQYNLEKMAESPLRGLRADNCAILDGDAGSFENHIKTEFCSFLGMHL